MAVTQGKLRWVRDVVLTVVLCALLSLLVFAAIKVTTEAHWGIGLLVTLIYACAVCSGVADLRSRDAKRFPIHKGVGILCLTAASAIAIAASASLQLLRPGWADYEPTPPADQAYTQFVTYYVWVLLDMLPGLEATELLILSPGLKPKNVVAGIPVVAFRTFVLFVLLAALQAWWKGRTRGTRDAPT